MKIREFVLARDTAMEGSEPSSCSPEKFERYCNWYRQLLNLAQQEEEPEQQFKRFLRDVRECFDDHIWATRMNIRDLQWSLLRFVPGTKTNKRYRLLAQWNARLRILDEILNGVATEYTIHNRKILKQIAS